VVHQSEPASRDSEQSTCEGPLCCPVFKTARRAWVILALCVLAVVGLCFYFLLYAARTPPDLSQATLQEVVAYLVAPRGLAKLPLDRREQYLIDAYQRFARDDEWGKAGRLFRQVPPVELEIFRDAVFEIGRARFMGYAREFNRLPADQRRAYLDQTIRNITEMGARLGGQIDKARSLAEPLKEVIPSDNDALMQYVITKTSPRERAEAQALVDALLQRYAELKNPRERKHFEQGQ